MSTACRDTPASRGRAACGAGTTAGRGRGRRRPRPRGRARDARVRARRGGLPRPGARVPDGVRDGVPRRRVGRRRVLRGQGAAHRGRRALGARGGLRVDTASGGELAVALRAGVPGPEIGLHGNNKSDAEIGRALDEGVGRIIVDSLVEVEGRRSRGARRVAPVMVRVTTGVHAGGHEYISTAHEDQKFGLSIAAPPRGRRRGRRLPGDAALLDVVARPELHLLGIHSHIGSQILDPSGFEVAARAVLELRARLAARSGVLVDEVDIGAATASRTSRATSRSTRSASRRTCARGRGGGRGARHAAAAFSIEPGRAIVGPAGLTLYTVGT
nr:hypothetical protein [Cellulosimicrobium sp. MM]